MGGAVSTGRNNDDLVDNLMSADYIRTAAVQKLFRAVDRADYFLPQCRKNAYKDLAWKSGNLHLSAPCIYSEVMEGLNLKPNLSFLNLGSGTGYLSTMVGLSIGNGGINHGVEIFPEVIEYALRKLEEFKRYSSAIDEYDFCEPKFIQGNCLCLSSDTLQYDRVYCGGACPASHINYMKNLIKVGGILVMPVEDQLMQIERISETKWEERSLLPVSFATLLMPQNPLEILNMMDVEPCSLQEMCRTVIRNVLRNNIDKQYPKLKILPKRKRISKRKHALKRTILPHLDTSDEGSEGEDAHARKERTGERCTNGIQSRSIGAFIDIVLGRIPDTRHSLFNNNTSSSSEPNASNDSTESESKMEHQVNGNTNDSSSEIQNQQCNGVNLHNDSSVALDAIAEQSSHSSLETEPNTSNGTVIARIMLRKRNRDAGIEEFDEHSDEDECIMDAVAATTPNKAKTTETLAATKTKREKFDSGLGDEIVSTSSDGEAVQEAEDSKNGMDVESSSSSDDEGPKNPTNESSETSFHSLSGRHWRTVTVPTCAVDHLLGLDDENYEDESEPVFTPQPVIGPYTILMRDKIEELPLPQTLKNYINYYKEF